VRRFTDRFSPAGFRHFLMVVSDRRPRAVKRPLAQASDLRLHQMAPFCLRAPSYLSNSRELAQFFSAFSFGWGAARIGALFPQVTQSALERDSI
jgi:hypothetical protein